MIFLIDNYDSFTYNIVQYFGQLKQQIIVKRNDQTSLAEIEQMQPDYLVISPGPGAPKEAGISIEAIQYFAGKLPIFGVCLGLQSIGEAFGGHIIRAQTLMHGKTSEVFHNNSGVFAGLPNPVTCTRYHSLVVERATLPECLEITAWTDDGEIMGLKHKTLAIEGVQFHPEALLTNNGLAMLDNFLIQNKDKV
ncbi:anthranilate synthase component II [Neisseria sp. Ec49-e6-T10]|uniref:anthranilate synthase component II n=1 Tax=Neisseria sp. Ec49-e6-T10 TaxID=3140744 RepID=UPI003EBC417D